MMIRENAYFIMKPKVDFCFKELMEDAEVRRGFISALLNIQPDAIEETLLIATHLRKEHTMDKFGVLDICVLLNGTTQIDVEIQVASFPLWPERSLFYLCKLFSGRIYEGENYGSLGKCIHVGILDFVLFPEVETYHSCYHFWEDARRQLYTDKMEIHILELPKLAQKEYPASELLDWVRFLSADSREEMERMAEKNEYIEKAYERLKFMSADEIKRREYLAREMAIRDHNYLMGENLRQGRAQGRAEGRAEGITEGEVLKLIGLARKKRNKGVSAEDCADILEENVDLIRQVYETMEEHLDWEDSMIYEMVFAPEVLKNEI